MKRAKKNNPTILKKLSDIENLLKKKDDRPLNFKEACAYLGFAPSYLYKLTYRKVIPHYKPTGKVLFFSKNELDEWIFAKSKVKIQKSKDEKIMEESEEDDESEAEP
jgi:excisionase family DNA binding protein